MWGRGMLGPFLVWVVRQQLQDREDPEAGTEAEPREEPTLPKSTATPSGQSAGCNGTPCNRAENTFILKPCARQATRSAQLSLPKTEPGVPAVQGMGAAGQAPPAFFALRQRDEA